MFGDSLQGYASTSFTSAFVASDTPTIVLLFPVRRPEDQWGEKNGKAKIGQVHLGIHSRILPAPKTRGLFGVSPGVAFTSGDSSKAMLVFRMTQPHCLRSICLMILDHPYLKVPLDVLTCWGKQPSTD